MNLTKFDPFRELEDVSTRLSRIFGQPPARLTFGRDDALSADWAPAVDVQETDSEYLVKADLPDVKKEDVTVEIVDGTLNVRGERHKEKEEKGKRFHLIEREYGRFERRLAVPAGVDAQKVAAEFKDGVLRVHLPKSPNAKPKSIDVKVA
jgi:HSP20 family protein